MNRNKCRIILDITETFSFTKTASRLGYTQSAVSQAVRQRDPCWGSSYSAGTDLPSLSLPEGRELVPFFKNICAAYDNLFDNAKSIKNMDRGMFHRLPGFSRLSAWGSPQAFFLILRQRSSHVNSEILFKNLISVPVNVIFKSFNETTGAIDLLANVYCGS